MTGAGSSLFDDVKDGQVAVPFEREPGGSHESDFRRTGEVMREEHPILLSGEVRTRELQRRHLLAGASAALQRRERTLGTDARLPAELPEDMGCSIACTGSHAGASDAGEHADHGAIAQRRYA